MSRIVHLPVTRRARLAVQRGVGAPGGEGESPGAFSELWILLHGYRQLAPRFIRHFRALHDPGRLLVAPEGLSRFYLEGSPGPHRGGDPVGASWMTREDREAEIEDYVGYLDEVLEWGQTACAGHGRRTSVRVLGFSQGVHTAARWVALGEAFREPELRARTRLLLWGTALPGDLPEEGLERFRILESLILVRGEEDQLRVGGDEEKEEARLGEAGIDYRVQAHPGGHRIDGALLRELAVG
ncbi:MAG: phospholipase [Gemmatimonadales bacterium]|nr:MAG: phospholipase [Gemmatimonadales bacterium]